MFFCPEIIFHTNEFLSDIHSELLQTRFKIVPIHDQFFKNHF
jgi:hypothetical protein